MGFFKNTEKVDKTVETASKELELAKAKMQEAEKAKLAAEEKQKQKDQMDENENVDSFIEDEESVENDEVLITEISKMIEDKGAEETLNYLDTIKNQIIVGLIGQPTETDKEVIKDDSELPEEFKEE